MPFVPLLSLMLAVLPPQEPIRIGVVAVDKPDSGDLHFLRAGRLAVDACNGKGGVLGSPVELVVEAAATPADAMAAVGRLDGAGVVAVIAPPETRLGEVVRRAAQSKMPCAGFAPQPAAIARTLDALLSKTFRVQQIAFVRDASKEAHELGRLLAKGGLSAPTEVLYELELGISAKALAKKLDAERPEQRVPPAFDPVDDEAPTTNDGAARDVRERHPTRRRDGRRLNCIEVGRTRLSTRVQLVINVVAGLVLFAFGVAAIGSVLIPE